MIVKRFAQLYEDENRTPMNFDEPTGPAQHIEIKDFIRSSEGSGEHETVKGNRFKNLPTEQEDAIKLCYYMINNKLDKNLIANILNLLFTHVILNNIERSKIATAFYNSMIS